MSRSRGRAKRMVMRPEFQSRVQRDRTKPVRDSRGPLYEAFAEIEDMATNGTYEERERCWRLADSLIRGRRR